MIMGAGLRSVPRSFVNRCGYLQAGSMLASLLHCFSHFLPIPDFMQSVKHACEL